MRCVWLGRYLTSGVGGRLEAGSHGNYLGLCVLAVLICYSLLQLKPQLVCGDFTSLILGILGHQGR